MLAVEQIPDVPGGGGEAVVGGDAQDDGPPLRRWALQAKVAAESAIPAESFASVLPVQGATIRRSSMALGPRGSTSWMVFRIGRPQISSTS